MKTNTASERGNWTVEEILSGITESPAAERMGDRFTVFCDGDRYPMRDKRALRKFLLSVYAKQAKVFRNFDKGITIDFDNGGVR